MSKLTDPLTEIEKAQLLDAIPGNLPERMMLRRVLAEIDRLVAENRRLRELLASRDWIARCYAAEERAETAERDLEAACAMRDRLICENEQLRAGTRVSALERDLEVARRELDEWEREAESLLECDLAAERTRREQVEAALRASKDAIRRWCADVDDSDAIYFICETLEPIIDAALAPPAPKGD